LDSPYLYRHLGVDAIAGANAVMLGNFKVTGKKGAEDSAQLLSGCATASYKNATTTGGD